MEWLVELEKSSIMMIIIIIKHIIIMMHIDYSANKSGKSDSIFKYLVVVGLNKCIYIDIFMLNTYMLCLYLDKYNKVNN